MALVLFVDIMERCLSLMIASYVATYVGEMFECWREYGNTHDLYAVAERSIILLNMPQDASVVLPDHLSYRLHAVRIYKHPN